MRRMPPNMFVVLCTLLAVPPVGLTQPAPSPVIHRVTIEPDTGILTITGTGLGEALVVSVEGQAVAVLPGATDRQLDVAVPAAILNTPGAYRLTVVDPTRHVGDAFVVVSPTASQPRLEGVSAVPAQPRGREQNGTSISGTDASSSLSGIAATPPGVSPFVIENATNTAVGVNALDSVTTGIQNLAAGVNALTSNTTGAFNVAVGSAALLSNSGGENNTAVGYASLSSNTTGDANTASGTGALFNNTTGLANTASGHWALFTNTTGIANTASGYLALYSNSTGGSNTATGYFALNGNTTGAQNTANGIYALTSNSTGVSNTASGSEALKSNTTGASNTATGDEALFSNSAGFFNTATGASALRANDGSDNTATGHVAMRNNTTGNANTATGTASLHSNTAGAANTADGAFALYSATGFDNTAVGHSAGANTTTGSYNVFLGSQVHGDAADTNTIRIGFPYDGFGGQDRTFIAGIHGSQLTGPAVHVYVDANGQLGTINAPILTGTGSVGASAAQRQVQELEKTIAELRKRLERLETLVTAGSGRK